MQSMQICHPSTLIRIETLQYFDNNRPITVDGIVEYEEWAPTICVRDTEQCNIVQHGTSDVFDSVMIRMSHS